MSIVCYYRWSLRGSAFSASWLGVVAACRCKENWKRLPKHSDRHVGFRKCMFTPSVVVAVAVSVAVSFTACMQHLLSASMWHSQVDLAVMCKLH